MSYLGVEDTVPVPTVCILRKYLYGLILFSYLWGVNWRCDILALLRWSTLESGDARLYPGLPQPAPCPGILFTHVLWRHARNVLWLVMGVRHHYCRMDNWRPFNWSSSNNLWFILCGHQGFGAGLFWAAPALGSFYPEPAPTPGKREHNVGFFLNWLRIV